MAVSVIQDPTLAVEDKEVILTAKLGDAAPAAAVTWTRLAGEQGIASGSQSETYKIAKAKLGGRYEAKIGAEPIVHELRFPQVVEAELEPMFSPVQLAWVGGVLLVLGLVISILAKALVDGILGRIGSGYLLGATMSLLIFVVGVAVLFGALWLQVADLRKPKATIVPPPTPEPGEVATVQGAANVVAAALSAVVEKLGAVLKDLKPSVVLALFGVVLLLMSGFIAAQSLPSTDGCSYVLVIGEGQQATRIEIPEGQPPPLSVPDNSMISAEPCPSGDAEPTNTPITNTTATTQPGR